MPRISGFSKILDKTLVIKDPKEDVFGVIGRMEVLLDYFRLNSKYKNLIPFLETYYLITKAVAEKQFRHPQFFQKPDLLSKLDVHFASLFFQPLRIYLESGKAVKPWQNYFSYCERKDGTPFVQMFLGINAHINGDLATSLRGINYQVKEDFFLVNKILHEEIPAVMKFLAFAEHDYYVVGGYFIKKLIEEEFRKVVVGWRLQAWQNARLPSLNREHINQTEKMGRNLIGIFDKLSFFKSWRHLAQEINGLKVKIN